MYGCECCVAILLTRTYLRAMDSDNLSTAVAGDKKGINIFKGALLLAMRAKKTTISSFTLFQTSGGAAIVGGI